MTKLLIFAALVVSSVVASAKDTAEGKKEPRAPAAAEGVYIQPLGEMPLNGVIRIWDSVNRIVCYAMSTNLSGSGGSISCFQK